MHLKVTPVKIEELTNAERPKLTSADIRERVLQARALQAERFKDLKDVYANVRMPSRMVREVCQLSPDGRIEDLAEAIHYRSLDREGWAGCEI